MPTTAAVSPTVFIRRIAFHEIEGSGRMPERLGPRGIAWRMGRMEAVFKRLAQEVPPDTGLSRRFGDLQGRVDSILTVGTQALKRRDLSKARLSLEAVESGLDIMRTVARIALRARNHRATCFLRLCDRISHQLSREGGMMKIPLPAVALAVGGLALWRLVDQESALA